jgi:hypothetical protein
VAEGDLDSHRRRLYENIGIGCGFMRSGSSMHRGGGALAMKISLDIDCTAEEARKFLGLPDVEPVQETLLKEVQDRLTASIKAMDPKSMLETWLPATLKGFSQLQEAFLSRMAGAGKKE